MEMNSSEKWSKQKRSVACDISEKKKRKSSATAKKVNVFFFALASRRKVKVTWLSLWRGAAASVKFSIYWIRTL